MCVALSTFELHYKAFSIHAVQKTLSILQDMQEHVLYFNQSMSM